MNVEITSEAKEKLREVMGQSDFNQPALKIVYSGIG